MPVELYVGNVRVRPGHLHMERDGTSIAVEPKVMETLLYLAERPAETVKREELMAAVWPEVHVSDDALNRCIWKLRRALGDDSNAPRFVETVPKRGYRLVAPVRRTRSTEEDALHGGYRVRFPMWWLGAVGAATAVLVGLVYTYTHPDNVRPSGLDVADRLTNAAEAIAPFTSLDGYESAPAFSPDGARVAFHRVQFAGSAPGQFDVWVRDVDGGEAPVPIAATVANETFPAWSPDGVRLAYRRQDSKECELVVATLGTGVEKSVGSCDPGVWSSLSWASDGGAILVSESDPDGGPQVIVRLSTTDGSRNTLTSPSPHSEGDTDPRVSPNTEWLAFVRTSTRDVQDVFAMRTDGSELRRVTKERGRIAGFAWSKDSRSIVYSSNRLGPFRLFSVPIDGGVPSAILTVGINATAPAVSPDESLLVYEEWDSRIDVRRNRLAGIESSAEAVYVSEPLVVSTRWDVEGRWSPDGKTLAYFSDREGSTDVWLERFDVDAVSPRRVTELGVRFSSWLRWSPDGTRLAFAAPIGGQFDIHVLDLRKGRVTKLAAGIDSHERWPAWSPDGRWLYFGSNRSGAWEIWRQSPDDTLPEPVTSSGGMVPGVSEEGELYYVKAAEPGLWKYDPHGEDRVLVQTVLPAQTSWDLHGGTAYVVETSPGKPPAVVGYGLQNGHRSLVAVLESPSGGYPEWFSGASISISPDGRDVVFSSIERSASDLWLARRTGLDR